MTRTNAEKGHKVFILKICKKMKHDNCFSLTSDILEWWKSSNHVLASKFKCIRFSFVITTPFTGNAQLHLCSTVWVLSIKMTSSPFQIPRRRTHYFVKRAKRATDLFKTFNLTIGLQKTADGFWSEHVFEFCSIFWTIETMKLFYQILPSAFQRSKKVR